MIAKYVYIFVHSFFSRLSTFFLRKIYVEIGLKLNIYHNIHIGFAKASASSRILFIPSNYKFTY